MARATTRPGVRSLRLIMAPPEFKVGLPDPGPSSKVHLLATRDFTASSRRPLPGRKTEKSDLIGPYEDRNDVSVILEDDTEVGFGFGRVLVRAEDIETQTETMTPISQL